jgi:hypothetical protein
MSRAALTPVAETQQMAMVWLSEYSLLFGDDSPTRDEVHLAAMRKTDIYIDYVKAFQECSRPVVNLNFFWSYGMHYYLKFVSAHMLIFVGNVTHVSRFKIFANDSRIQWAAKRAHHLHRGGMFMLERAEYQYYYVLLFCTQCC